MKHLTDKQIEEIKEKLIEERNKILNESTNQIKDTSNIEFQGGDEIDRGDIEGSRYIIYRTMGRKVKLLKKIDYALSKIENGTFGICEMCGAEIPYDRLLARPVTTMCILCKEYEEENENE